MTNKEKTLLQKEIVSVLPEKPHGRLLLAPRVGKTKLAIDIIKKVNPKSILWVTPSAELAEKTIPSELETWKAKKYLPRLTTSTWMSLDKVVGYYDLIILDEEQFATENNMQNLLSGQLSGWAILSMTGTETKHETKLDLYKALKLPILYQMSINEAVDIGLLANYTIKVLEVDMETTKTFLAGNEKKRFFTTESANYSYLNAQANMAISANLPVKAAKIRTRMRAIYNSPAKHKAAQYLMRQLTGRKLFFCSSIEQAEKLCANFYHSKTDNSKLLAFKEGLLDTITMVNTGGVGETYKAIDHLVMVQADSDKNGLTSQKLCRTLLDQKDYKATIWIICLLGTQDEKWIASTLENFDKSKVEYIRFTNLINQQL